VTDIIKGVTNIVPNVQAVLVDMENKYKKIWDTDKDAYMRRYKRNAGQRDFDGDIQHYLELIDEIRSEEAVINVQFLQIDQQPLKAVRHSFPTLAPGAGTRRCRPAPAASRVDAIPLQRQPEAALLQSRCARARATV
jgi:hypothetical protein